MARASRPVPTPRNAPSALVRRLGLTLAAASCMALPALAASAGRTVGSERQLDGNYWQDLPLNQRQAAASARQLPVTAWRALTLERADVSALAVQAPMEFTTAARLSPATITLPHPDGSFQRFTLVESPVMEDGLAAKHPEIKTYAGRGIDDPTATLRMDITPMGLHASVRSSRGGWYVEPAQKLDQSVYASYLRSARLPDSRGLREPVIDTPQLSVANGRPRSGEAVEVHGAGFAPGSSVTLTLRDADGRAVDVRSANADAEGVVNASFAGTRVPGDYTVEAAVTATPITKTTRGAAAASGDAEPAAPLSTPVRVLAAQEPQAASVGTQLRTYRVALLTDPTYASYVGGSANVTAAKVTLMNRVTQVYEDETSIRLKLINDSDKLNLDTDAQMTGANGPCGGAACFTASQATSCVSSTLSRNRLVVGLLVGARNFDIGHIGMGTDGGGVASLGVVGGTSKAQGCTGITTPVGDAYAVDYVAHEMGHQFGGDHTFNGVTTNCSSTNRNAATSVEPGSGSSVMAYAGICHDSSTKASDDLQSHSDAYWSMKSFDEITTYTGGAETNVAEVQMAVLTGFNTNGQQFAMRWNGQASAPIVRGTNFTTAGIKAAIQGISGWPSGTTVTVSALSDNAFTITFAGTLANTATPILELTDCTGGCTGKVGEIAVGGLSTRGGAIVAKDNAAPVVTAPAGYTIPLRTPFALTGSATDADGDTLSYMWEQTDRGGSTGTLLTNNTKANGPLFRQFGTSAVVTGTDTLEYNSPGENIADGSPTRVFPDMTQILANNTNAATGACPAVAAGSYPTAEQVNCYSEFLPTAAYVGASAAGNASPARLNFRLTARDGNGGVSSAATVLTLAANTGPFLVTAPNTAVTLVSELPQAVSWNVAGTSAAPVNAANVKITLSTDGGASFPHVLAASVPNNGSASVRLPNVATSLARVKIEAVDNVFFDVSDANFTIRLYADVNVDGVVDCTDMALVKAKMGKRTGQVGYDAMADVNSDGVIDVRDLSIVSQHLPTGTVCR